MGISLIGEEVEGYAPPSTCHPLDTVKNLCSMPLTFIIKKKNVNTSPQLSTTNASV